MSYGSLSLEHCPFGQRQKKRPSGLNVVRMDIEKWFSSTRLGTAEFDFFSVKHK